MMRVLHVLRRDHAGHVGGDLTQLHASVSALRDASVNADAVEPDQLDDSADVVHLYNLQLPFELAGAYLLARRRCPRALVALSPIYWPLDRDAVRRERGVPSSRALLHAVGPRRRAEWLICRYILTRADLILPNSRVEASRVADHFRVGRRNNWLSVPNGIWVDRWAGKADHQPNRNLRIACVARLEPQKNQLRLVEAVSAVPGAELDLIGPPGEAAYANRVLEAMSNCLGARGRCHGARTPEEVLDLLSMTDVHVLPSFRETPGLASLEAAAVGCAVVATREGSAEEYFGGLAHYADPRSAASIAAAIRAASLKPNQPELTKMVRQYDWSLIGRRLHEAYASILARSATRS